jgi:hypothetical protein
MMLPARSPANNVSTNTGIDWNEGMSPAQVNNSARQNMTDIRAAFNDLIWFRYGKGDLDYSPVYASGTTFTVAGADVTVPYHIGRRLKAVGSGTGTIYGTISAAAFSTNTTVTVVWDSGSLSNETLTIYLSQIPVTGSPVSMTAGPAPATFSGVSLSAAYSQLATLSLPPGKYELSGGASTISSSPGYIIGAFSTTTASNAGTTFGVTEFAQAGNAATALGGITMPSSEITLTTTTSYYFNAKADGAAGGFAGIFRAKRISP